MRRIQLWYQRTQMEDFSLIRLTRDLQILDLTSDLWSLQGYLLSVSIWYCSGWLLAPIQHLLRCYDAEMSDLWENEWFWICLCWAHTDIAERCWVERGWGGALRNVWLTLYTVDVCLYVFLMICSWLRERVSPCLPASGTDPQLPLIIMIISPW